MKRVVLADDEPITRLNIASMLEDIGFAVVGEAGDGFDAVELCRAQHPDLVLMDVKMPVFDGLTASKTIITEGLADCVVLLTAYDDQAIIDQASHIGLTGYLVKPIEPRLLLPTITVAMAQSARLHASQRETKDALQRLQNEKVIQRAQMLMAEQYHISPMEAYRKLQQMSMDKRLSMLVIAEAVIEQIGKKDVVNTVKEQLMHKKGISEAAAYRQISSLAKQNGCTPAEAAEMISRKMGRANG